MPSRALTACLFAACSLGLAACGASDDPEPAVAATPSAATSCPDVPVPGHLAENVEATGLTCAETVPIANMAEGLGRAAYESDGFACEPRDAAGGKTNYTCTKGDATLTFLYG